MIELEFDNPVYGIIPSTISSQSTPSTSSSSPFDLEADIVIVVKDWQCNVHRSILVSRSTVFAELLNERESNDRNSGNTTSGRKIDRIETSRNHKRTCIVIDDFEPTIINQLITYMYNGTIGVNTNQDGGAEMLLCQLWLAAQKYRIVGLQTLCEQQLFAHINEETVYNLYQFSYNHNLMHLKSKTIDYIDRHLLDDNGTKNQLDAMYANLSPYETQLVEFEYWWRIDQFSQKLDNLQEIESSIFHSPLSEQQKFCLTLYPQSYNQMCEGYVSIFLNYFRYNSVSSTSLPLPLGNNLTNSGHSQINPTTQKKSHTNNNVCSTDKLGLLFAISILDKNGKFCFTKNGMIRLPIFKGYGYPNFILRSQLSNADILPDDRLTIRCKIAIPIRSDAILKINNEKEFHINRAFLASKSMMLAKLLNDLDSQKKLYVLEITDAKMDVIETILRFIYKSKIGSIDYKTEFRILEACHKAFQWNKPKTK